MVDKTVIWVVEDDPATQRIVAEHLRLNGFDAVVYDSAEKAYAALQRNELPSLIVLDMLLPGMSGVDLIRLIKQNQVWKGIPVVVVTVLSRKDAPGGAGETASAYWVNKPFDTNNLMQTIQGILTQVRK